MKKILFVGLAVAAILAIAPAAMAFDTTYYLSINASGDSTQGVSPFYGVGTITVAPIAGDPGYFNITSANILINGSQASLTPFIGPPAGVGNPSTTGGVSNFYVNRQNAITGGCQGFSDDFCIPFDNKITNIAPGQSPGIDANGLLFQIKEGSTLVELAIWLDNSGLSSDPYNGDYLWNEFVGTYSSGNYNQGTGQPNWVVPLTTDDGEGGLPVGLNIGPEPSSLLLLGTGLMSMAGLIFWKSRMSTVKVK